MYAFQPVEKADRELLKVSKCDKVLILPGSKLRIIIYTSGTIANRYLTVLGPKGRYYGAFPMSLHLFTFLFVSEK